MPKLSLRFPVLLLALLALLAGMWAGLLRLGWIWPPLNPLLPVEHGPLMVSGFLGTLIGLERSVALSMTAVPRRKWLYYLSPAITGIGSLLILTGLNVLAGAVMIWIGSVGLLIMFGLILKRHTGLDTAVMALGALCWLAGNTIWLGRGLMFQVTWWWAAFLILTIAGERLELSRVLRIPQQPKIVFGLIILLQILGLILLMFAYDGGVRLFSFSLILLSLWLIYYDLARRNIHQSGLTRFIAVCLLSGYFWLLAAGMIGIVFGGVIAGFRYDAILHSIFLGFVFAMIFGHAPIIFPAVLNVAMKYSRAFYIPLILLHLSLILRVGSDLLLWFPGRQYGGLLNVLVLLLFLLNTIIAIIRGQKESGARPT